MTPRLARLLVRVYPRAWRDRYGAEFEALLHAETGNASALANVILAALWERVRELGGRSMGRELLTFGSLTRRPSACVPLGMSLMALTVIAVGPLLFGDLHAKDEGPTAHIWQLLMAGQMPVVAFFAVTRLRRAPKQTLQVLGLQVGGVLANCAVVFLLGVG
jgi:hypothetical protein